MAEDTNQKGAPPGIKQTGQKKVLTQEEQAQTRFRPSPYQPPCPPAACPAPENEGDEHKTKPPSRWFTGIKSIISDGFLQIIRIVNKLRPPDDALINAPQTTVTIATPTKPESPEVLATAGQTGYDRVFVFLDGQRISSKIWVINDGPGTLFVIASYNLVKWSGESEIFLGEYRAFFNVYELRVRSPNAATRYRLTEYEPDLAVVENQGSFTAQNIAAPFPAPGINLSNIPVPSGFALVVRANVNNAGQVYIAGPIPAGVPPNPLVDAITNVGVAATRDTLNAGDTARLYVVNANLAAILGSAAGNTVDILVEQ